MMNRALSLVMILCVGYAIPTKAQEQDNLSLAEAFDQAVNNKLFYQALQIAQSPMLNMTAAQQAHYLPILQQHKDSTPDSSFVLPSFMDCLCAGTAFVFIYTSVGQKEENCSQALRVYIAVSLLWGLEKWFRYRSFQHQQSLDCLITLFTPKQ